MIAGVNDTGDGVIGSAAKYFTAQEKIIVDIFGNGMHQKCSIFLYVFKSSKRKNPLTRDRGETD